jgi:hypothetical protein
MREYLFRGKRTDNDEWVYGSPIFQDGYVLIRFWNSEEFEYEEYLVAPESVGMYTEMNEFVLIDATHNAPLFEGDIVEVCGWRTVRGRNQSQYDRRVRVRGVIYFAYGEWSIDYDNNYNKSLEKLKGSEVQEREVSGASRLYFYGCHRSDREEYRIKELEWKRKFYNSDDEIDTNSDIKKIGNVFDNADLLEG